MEAIIFVGIQGSGKSTFYRECFFHTHVRINLDMLKTRHREKILLAACIEAKQPFVVDNTNVRRIERTRYIAPAMAAGFRVVAYFFEPDVRRAIAWNQRRAGPSAIPVKGLLGTYKQLEPPRFEEGFDLIHSVHIDPANEFVVQEWRMGGGEP